ncbi:unnamed protein product [Psylliodes chrysocephalus]|uniref:COMM domain-containing protein n=1 Tax=Psylliodes chrysocephalus TaxID=3402493 RepID=A0A9P0D184_9CUCU|nr:unnamed protein product [Psylliodes chrysocephala]
MNLKWISVNERLKQGIQLINALSTKTFNLLLSDVINIKEGETFTEDEFGKLKESLKLNDDSLQLLIQSISHIFKQSNKVIIKPTILYKQLCENIGLDAAKCEEFVKLWCNQTNQDFGDYSDRLKLEHLTWELNILASDQINPKQSVPTARIQLELAKSANSSEKEKVVLEFDQSELLQLYSHLEKIQLKFDNINTMCH